VAFEPANIVPLAPQTLFRGKRKMTDKPPSERQRKKWREDRARLRAMALAFPVAPKPVLTPAEKRAIKTHNERERRAAKRLGEIDLTCPIFHQDGRIRR
jgi:hypothetical protein